MFSIIFTVVWFLLETLDPSVEVCPPLHAPDIQSLERSRFMLHPRSTWDSLLFCLSQASFRTGPPLHLAEHLHQQKDLPPLHPSSGRRNSDAYCSIELFFVYHCVDVQIRLFDYPHYRMSRSLLSTPSTGLHPLPHLHLHHSRCSVRFDV